MEQRKADDVTLWHRERLMMCHYDRERLSLWYIKADVTMVQGKADDGSL